MDCAVVQRIRVAAAAVNFYHPNKLNSLVCMLKRNEITMMKAKKSH